MSIGRDSFWTPAHVAIQMCGIIAGFSCGYLILSCTFGHDEALRAASVKVWGFRGPLGAFIAAWGGATMLTSAPFDNCWHHGYGLDVKIFSGRRGTGYSNRRGCPGRKHDEPVYRSFAR